MKSTLIFFLLFTLILPLNLFTQIPQTLSYQGVLTDSSSNPKPDGVYTFTFRFYDVASGGGVLWTEIKDLQVKRGLFSTTLGDVASFGQNVSFEKQYWLGIKVGSDPELPNRVPLSAVGYSLRSIKSDTAIVSLSAPPSGTAGGDLSGTYPNPTVGRLQGRNVASNSPTDKQVLKWNSANNRWEPAGDSSGSGGAISGTTNYIPLFTSGASVGNSEIYQSNGNIGIGTSNPVSHLHINDLPGRAQFRITSGSNTGTTENDGISITNAGTTKAYLIQHEDDYMYFVINSNPYLTISPLGNIGIGTITPSAKLVVAGGDARVNNVTVGLGGGSILDNAAFGYRSLYYNTIGINNTAVGNNSLYSNSTGNSNTAIGSLALYSNTTGISNTANGLNALYSNTTGSSNTANGQGALSANIAGSNATAVGNMAMYYANNTSVGFINRNVAVGYEALRGSTDASANTGNNNTAIGYQTLLSNTSGSNNTATGLQTLLSNTSGSNNTATGLQALYSNTTGTYNTAYGYSALNFNTTGYDNNANGSYALRSNTSGYNNIAEGSSALFSNTTGDNNTGIGRSALLYTTTGFQNTSLGSNSLVSNTTGSYNTAIGYNTGPNSANLFNTTCIGIDATATGSDMVRIGNVFVTSIGGQVGWSTLSDGRFKENISEDVPGLDFITKLRPVTYQVNREKVNEFTGVMERRSKIATDNNTNEPSVVSNQLPEIVTGFIAQEVEAVAQQLGYNFSGVDKPKNESDYYGLRYAEFVVPLVKAVQEQQKRIQELEAIVAELIKEKQ